MVFARTADDALASLVRQVDRIVVTNAEQKLASFVNFLGPDKGHLLVAAEEFGTQHDIQNVALVVPVDHENGPDNMKLHPNADVTVMLYKGAKVQASHAVARDRLDEARVAAIVADTAKILE